MTALVWTSAVAGLIAGSFAHVVARRIPAGESIVSPGSRCSSCSAPIRWYDNIPVLSFALLGGRCRDCRASIGWRYPAAELATAAVFAGAAAAIGWRWVFPAYLWFGGVTMVLMITDLDHKLIPNRILFPGTAAGAALLGVGALIDGDAGRIGQAVVGAAALFAVLYVLALIARGGFGYGDVKLGFLLGLFLGYQRLSFVAACLFLAFFAGGVVSLLLVVTRVRSRKDTIPFGPYLVLAAYVVLMWGPQLIDWYLY